MARIGMSAPWVIFYREIEEMFREDPEVRVVYDEDKNVVTLYVDNAAKAEALTSLLPEVKEFGNVELPIIIKPSNRLGESKANIYATAFTGNPVLSYIRTIRGIFTNDLTYVVFKNKVVQYYNDDLSDVNGMCSTLYQNIAKDLFGESEGVFFCTDLPANNGVVTPSLGRPLGEWP